MRLVILIAVVLLPLHGCVSNAKYGTQDSDAAKNIERVNELAGLRSSGKYKNLTERLTEDLSKYSANQYAKSRINYELADLYSYQYINLEMAIDGDERLIDLGIPSSDSVGDFYPKHIVAGQRILADREYLNDYIAVSSETIRERAKTRLETNRALLNGIRPNNSSDYSISFIREHLNAVGRDISSTPPGSSDRLRIYSRLLRGEYELLKRGVSIEGQAFKLVLNGQLPVESIDLSEIDFLSLADYFTLMFRKSGDIRFAEHALDTVYRPYMNLRSPIARWKYNKIINDYISELINANYQSKNYDELLYYVSLNKSRVLLEERLLYSEKRTGQSSVSDISENDGMIRTRSGLPDKTWFRQKLAKSPQFVDFYVGGKYLPQSAGRHVAQVDRSTMPFTTRDFGVEEASVQSDAFVDDALFVSHVANGHVTSVTKLSGSQLKDLRTQLDGAYKKIAVAQGEGNKPGALLQKLGLTTGLPGNLVVSPDKWVAKYPLDYLMDAKITRTVNFFTAGSPDRLDAIRLTGFFNPTLDLPGAEQEAEVIRNALPGAELVRREAAKVEAFRGTTNANVIHLSMHGLFNADDPKNSKLYFSGARRGAAADDPHALYARDMGQVSALKDRDLVFAAACQTGLSAADQTNEGELMGILRPLTANRNKNIILSLWKVDDDATRDFVAGFYERLAQSKNINESFFHAQALVRAKYKHPYYWAAFYLSQAQ